MLFERIKVSPIKTAFAPFLARKSVSFLLTIPLSDTINLSPGTSFARVLVVESETSKVFKSRLFMPIISQFGLTLFNFKIRIQLFVYIAKHLQI